MAARKKARGESLEVRTRAMQSFLRHLDHPMKAEVAALRLIIKQASPKIHERVKWDAPSFYCRQDLLRFDLRTMKGVRLLVLLPPEVAPDGDLVKTDAEGMRAITFRNMADVTARAPALLQLVRDWVAAVSPGA